MATCTALIQACSWMPSLVLPNDVRALPQTESRLTSATHPMMVLNSGRLLEGILLTSVVSTSSLAYA